MIYYSKLINFLKHSQTPVKIFARFRMRSAVCNPRHLRLRQPCFVAQPLDGADCQDFESFQHVSARLLRSQIFKK